MHPLREELTIAGDNKDLTHYLAGLATAILESAVDVRNVKLNSTPDTCYNVTITYVRHPVGGWASNKKRK